MIALTTLAASCGKSGSESANRESTARVPAPVDARSWKTIKLPKKLPRWKLPTGKKRPVPAQPGTKLDVAALCKERHFGWLLVNRDGNRVQTVLATRAAAAVPGAITIGFGRHKGQRALPVSALLTPAPQIVAARLHSCGKPPRVISRHAAARWLLATNKKGQLKLMAAPGPGVPRTKPFRPVVLVELLDRH